MRLTVAKSSPAFNLKTSVLETRSPLLQRITPSNGLINYLHDSESFNSKHYTLFYVDKASFRAVFTNLGASGRFGPTTLGSFYTGQDHDGQVKLSSGIQQWTVPYTGEYRVEAIGAAGGYGKTKDKKGSTSSYRGRGARMTGSFSLSKGEIIHILVGQEGTINNSPMYPFASGGGGGTFVVRGGSTPLLIAGGGGGVETLLSRQPGCDASVSTTGNPGYRSWSGGSNGHGAQTADDKNSGKVIARSHNPLQLCALKLPCLLV